MSGNVMPSPKRSRSTKHTAAGAQEPSQCPQWVHDALAPFSSNMTEVPTRVAIRQVRPEIDNGRFPVKRAVGDRVFVEAKIFSDGHESLRGALLYKKDGEKGWTETPMVPQIDDGWQASFEVATEGRYRYTVAAWMDHFSAWRQGLSKKYDAGQDISGDLQIGAHLVDSACAQAKGKDAETLRKAAECLKNPGAVNERCTVALSVELESCMRQYPDKSGFTQYERELVVVVDPKRASFSTWYEFFPRSAATQPGRHGTFSDCEKRLPEIARMGFDVVYFPPIHPIGRSCRKGKNNSTKSGPEDPGSPWAIGAQEGGHDAIHPELGTLEDFRHLVKAANKLGIEIALDVAFQCSPDHPYVAQHPQWFYQRPDGSIQYAENPPKKYEDIYPLNFESQKWGGLWDELRRVVLFWIDQGARIFRVDNPHTKPFRFWEALIQSIKSENPDVIFLAEAFTRPSVMYELAKLGFTQSYTYFAWRNTKYELTQYFTELTQTETKEFFRPNLWPNTPDILTEYLQWGGRPAFITRFVLAATLGANYGIYGPAFELCEGRAVGPGKEEYLDSEKYQLRDWDLKRPERLNDLIAQVNKVRKEHPALQSDSGLRFHNINNEQLICYSKTNADKSDIILVVANLDYHHSQSGWVDLDLVELGLEASAPYQVHDLITDARFLWQGARNYVELNPHGMPAHLFSVKPRVRAEQDFDYFF